jgi:hypothetical protein
VVSVDAAATTIDRLASTHQGNAPEWAPMVGKRPFGQWKLVLRNHLSDGREPVEALRSGGISDILLIITYAAQMPAWPA